jgi:chemotaxis signal transduction protein
MTLLPRRTTPHTETCSRNALVFRLGHTRLALPADRVTTIAEVGSCTQIPSADPTLLGVGRVGLRLLPLIDAHRRMRVVASPVAGFPWTCLVVKSALGEVAFRIDEVLGLHAMPDGLAPLGCTLVSLERLVDDGAGVGEGA